jgi:HPt (histidine-containing phosphotransfer) domain-containing protein
MSSLADPSAIDLVQLARYTGGDRTLNCEVLQLFLDQSAGFMEDLPGILDAGDREAWHHIAHSLKGAARGIGAFAFADAAAEAEPLNPGIQPTEAAAALAKMTLLAEAVHSFIRHYLKS